MALSVPAASPDQIPVEFCAAKAAIENGGPYSLSLPHIILTGRGHVVLCSECCELICG